MAKTVGLEAKLLSDTVSLPLLLHFVRGSYELVYDEWPGLALISRRLALSSNNFYISVTWRYPVQLRRSGPWLAEREEEEIHKEV